MNLKFLKIFFRSKNILLSLSNIGIFAGLIVLPFARLLHLDFISYFGGLLTMRPTGTLNHVVGSLVCVIISMVSIYLYAAMFLGFKMLGIFLPLTISTFILFGFLHSIVSGICIKLIDFIHPCVRNATIDAMGFMGLARGGGSFFAFIFVHAFYAVICFEIFESVYILY